ncbi:MAG: hypothetical protein E6713_09985 [Sporomusaceae bacterium]|nr:hypothetical protein [Sporomusaceae bacterium]
MYPTSVDDSCLSEYKKDRNATSRQFREICDLFYTFEVAVEVFYPKGF